MPLGDTRNVLKTNWAVEKAMRVVVAATFVVSSIFAVVALLGEYGGFDSA